MSRQTRSSTNSLPQKSLGENYIDPEDVNDTFTKTLKPTGDERKRHYSSHSTDTDERSIDEESESDDDTTNVSESGQQEEPPAAAAMRKPPMKKRRKKKRKEKKGTSRPQDELLPESEEEEEDAPFDYNLNEKDIFSVRLFQVGKPTSAIKFKPDFRLANVIMQDSSDIRGQYIPVPLSDIQSYENFRKWMGNILHTYVSNAVITGSTNSKHLGIEMLVRKKTPSIEDTAVVLNAPPKKKIQQNLMQIMHQQTFNLQKMLQENAFMKANDDAESEAEYEFYLDIVVIQEMAKEPRTMKKSKDKKQADAMLTIALYEPILMFKDKISGEEYPAYGRKKAQHVLKTDIQSATGERVTASHVREIGIRLAIGDICYSKDGQLLISKRSQMYFIKKNSPRAFIFPSSTKEMWNDVIKNNEICISFGACTAIDALPPGELAAWTVDDEIKQRRDENEGISTHNQQLYLHPIDAPKEISAKQNRHDSYESNDFARTARARSFVDSCNKDENSPCYHSMNQDMYDVTCHFVQMFRNQSSKEWLWEEFDVSQGKYPTIEELTGNIPWDRYKTTVGNCRPEKNKYPVDKE